MPKASLSKRGLVRNHSYENEFNLHVSEISFSYEGMSTKTRFEKEAKGNSEMAYWFRGSSRFAKKRGTILLSNMKIKTSECPVLIKDYFSPSLPSDPPPFDISIHFVSS